MVSWHAIYHLFLGDGRPAEAAVTKVQASSTETGVTIDFPLPPDERRLADERAWRIFTIAIALLVGSLIWYSMCHVLEWRDAQGFSLLLFVLGILGLIVAVSSSSSGRHYPDRSQDVLQLAIAGNLLVRTLRDHRKQIWYQHEIRAIRIEEVALDPADSVHLLIELHSGEKVSLMVRPVAAKTELERIAVTLVRALFGDGDLSHAIQAKVAYADEDRFKQ